MAAAAAKRIMVTGANSGIGFAIPIRRAQEIAERLIERGSQEFWTGFRLQRNLAPWLARSLGLATSAGGLVARVEENSPASKSRLSPGDMIVYVNGERVRSDKEVARSFQDGRVGEVFELTVLRGRRQFDTRLVLEEAPAAN